MRDAVREPAALYPQLLEASWAELDPTVRRAHLESGPLRGSFQIRLGRTPGARLLAWLLRLPNTADDLETRLAITRHLDEEIWIRTFGEHRLVTRQREAPDRHLAERFGILELQFRLSVVDGGLRYQQRRAALRLGVVGFSLPAWLAPQVTAWERPVAADSPLVRVEVRVTLPAIGDLITYSGCLGWEAAP
jgi:uncharacterized protein DUF4166